MSTETDKRIQKHMQYLKWQEVGRSKMALHHLIYGISSGILEEAGIERAELKTIANRLKQAYFNSFKSFYVCESCNKKITNKKLRSDAVKTHGTCAVCNKKSSLAVSSEKGYNHTLTSINTVHKKVFNITLKEAKEYVQKHYPATFI